MSEEERPFPDSLCHQCAHVRYVDTKKGSTFLMCSALPQKYFPQPLLQCPSQRSRDTRSDPISEIEEIEGHTQ